jgi:hypothetical protein
MLSPAYLSDYISDVCNWVSRQHEHEALSFIPSHVYLKEPLENASFFLALGLVTVKLIDVARELSISMGSRKQFRIYIHQGKYIVLPSKTL